MSRTHLGGSVLLGLLAFAPAARAYRTATELAEFSGSERVRWATPRISYARTQTAPPGLTSAGVQSALLAAFGAWSEPPCSSISFVDDGTAASDPAPEDGTNTIGWVSTNWQDLGAPADAAAFTDVQYERTTGGEWQIVEADLYLNGEDHAWTLDPGDESARDLEAVVAHEAGHMLGLLHPCEFGGADGAPDCDSMPGAAQATMFPNYSAGQRTLAGDDQAGVCFLYPKSDDSGATGTAPAELGAACSEANDCLDRQCLAGLGDEPFCTKACSSSADCPATWECSPVDDRDVCAPTVTLVPGGGSGCRTSPVRPDAPKSALLFSIIAGLAALRRRSVGALGER